ncbi:hypothetical protein [Streptomyces sp. NPDC127072]|uniref:hypothetical protein n=1 Tax=Streptomyces sp. NPDC127072 TaxID=3347129 RepID=UPI0036656BCF
MRRQTILRSPWQPGPGTNPADGPVLVSFTDFTSDTFLRSWSVALDGLRLRRTWPATPGAIGMWLWADPPRRRSGSVSVWADEGRLKEFVGRPDHCGSCARTAATECCARRAGRPGGSTPQRRGRTRTT